MKLTKETLKRIIKEELEATLSEMEENLDPRVKQIEAAAGGIFEAGKGSDYVQDQMNAKGLGTFLAEFDDGEDTFLYLFDVGNGMVKFVQDGKATKEMTPEQAGQYLKTQSSHHF